MPFPSEETTPPVTKMCFAMMLLTFGPQRAAGFQTSFDCTPSTLPGGSRFRDFIRWKHAVRPRAEGRAVRNSHFRLSKTS